MYREKNETLLLAYPARGTVMIGGFVRIFNVSNRL